jgi:hypothetical protein
MRRSPRRNIFHQEKEPCMNKFDGVWIDHRKAVIVSISGDVENIHSIVSDVEKHVRHSGDSPEDRQEHRFSNHLKAYFENVITHLRDADAIFLFGPGEAKGEIKSRLEHDSMGAKIVGFETVDKMTDNQIAAKVREHFVKAGAPLVRPLKVETT